LIRAAAALAAGLVLAAGCGSEGPSSPEAVVRAWSDALDAGDMEAAADLFAPDAKVVQGSLRVLHDRGDALEWLRRLPCSASLVELVRYSDEVVDASFRLRDRKPGSCFGAGETVMIVLNVSAGQIELFHQLPPPPAYVPS
jgi:hypothetical protein